ncbi:hypothetical protein CROQUDRAFT_99674 [Cronartium quercuum f. sp. fusiforme G11]|uniref:Uncharacterized protein n=1 Tax=Cronartium quercuum f. sp. fusiforme G11 TaxID=708437 RepID=A0A9P6T6T7_9BASI|nr:hypothetical protein CROQUDRAFT_99674 [Cronartium quercuum f. sp. fusiforme G11]
MPARTYPRHFLTRGTVTRRIRSKGRCEARPIPPHHPAIWISSSSSHPKSHFERRETGLTPAQENLDPKGPRLRTPPEHFFFRRAPVLGLRSTEGFDGSSLAQNSPESDDVRRRPEIAPETVLKRSPGLCLKDVCSALLDTLQLVGSLYSRTLAKSPVFDPLSTVLVDRRELVNSWALDQEMSCRETSFSTAIDRAPSDRQSTVFGVGSPSRPSDGWQRRSEYRLLAYHLKSVGRCHHVSDRALG